MDSTSKVWFVTGASAGLGLAVVEYILKQGERVVATCRKPESMSALVAQHPSSQFIVVKLDVTSSSDITAAFATAIATFGRVDVVHNNAGYVILGEIEATPDEVARAEFEVNFWGATNVAREAVRVFRDVNKPSGGRLLQVSSLTGVQALPGLGYYSSTKFAFEGISEALSKEIHPSWNIKVTIIELGGYKTRITSNDSMVIVPPLPAYDTPDSVTKFVRAHITRPDAEAGDADKAAREIHKISGDNTVGLRVPLGLDALDIVKKKSEELAKVVEETGKWSVDLK